MEGSMTNRNQALAPALLASALGAATGWLATGTAAAQQAAPDAVAAGTVAATATGTLTPRAVPVVTARASGKGSALERATEPVVFGGQAAISGRVIHDTTFGAPPMLEIIVDLSKVTAKGVRSGRPYVLQAQAVVRRPLRAFEQMEVDFTFAPDGNVLEARSGLALFGVYYSAAKGMTTTPLRMSLHPPS
jgi:hypothetical protein